MLVLSRRKNESIVIGDNVEIIILAVSGGKIKLGIVATKDIPVYRKEIYEVIQSEKSKKD